MVQNGNIPLTSMLTLLNGQYLLKPAAHAVNTAVKVGHLLDVAIAPPTGGDKGISGYRDLNRQALFVQASHGNKAAAARCNIDPNMVTNMGAVGTQSHGWGDRIDLLFNGQSPSTWDIALMGRYGGIREFGESDRNHWWLKNPSTTVPESDMNRIVAHFLNNQHLIRDGKQVTTTANVDGVWPEKSNLSWMIQEYGSHQKGWYDPTKFKVDGDAGTRTKWVRTHLFNVIWNE